MADPAYLSDPAFKEPNKGPLITPHRPSDGRDPSLSQIAARAAAIRRCYPRRPVGESAERWTPPEVEGPADLDIERVA